jgi:hypothetical protein
MKFCTTNKNCVSLSIGYVDKTIEEVETTKFHGLQVDNNLNWKTHIQYIIPKLSSACFAMKTIYHITHENRNFCTLPTSTPSCHMELFSGETQ